MFECVSVCVSPYVFVCQSTSVCVRMSVYTCVCLWVNICESVFMYLLVFVGLSRNVSVYHCACLSVCICVCIMSLQLRILFWTNPHETWPKHSLGPLRVTYDRLERLRFATLAMRWVLPHKGLRNANTKHEGAKCKPLDCEVTK